MAFFTPFLGLKKFLKNSKKTLDIVFAIWFNATISLGAEKKTHRDAATLLFDSGFSYLCTKRSGKGNYSKCVVSFFFLLLMAI
jgi:hypothetical protein